MQNKLIDLNNHLFSQMERLNDETLTEKELRKELQRAKAMTDVAAEIIANGRLAFEVKKAVNDNQLISSPAMLGIESK